MPKLRTPVTSGAVTTLIAALFHAPSTAAGVITAIAALIIAIGIAGALLLTAKKGRMNITIGPAPDNPKAKDP